MYSRFNVSTGTSNFSDNLTFTASSSAFGISGFVARFKSCKISVLKCTLFSNSVNRVSDASFFTTSFNSFTIVSRAFNGKSSIAFFKLTFGASSSYLNLLFTSFSIAFSRILGFSPSTNSVFMRFSGCDLFISPVRAVSPSP